MFDEEPKPKRQLLCSRGINSFEVPPGCSSTLTNFGCDFYAKWDIVSDDEIEFTLKVVVVTSTNNKSRVLGWRGCQ